MVATVGTTSSTSVDPVPEIAGLCRRESIWLHVDAAYAGVAAMVPGYEWILGGAEHADSLVVNPHKWLFTPFDLSVLYCRHMDVVRAAFALTPEYLKTVEAAPVRNLMDTGVQLGRRFRALKLWMVLRHFGADGLRARLAEHMRLARLFGEWVDGDAAFERLAPVPFSVVCFRALPPPQRAQTRAGGPGRTAWGLPRASGGAGESRGPSMTRTSTLSTSGCSKPSTRRARCSSPTHGSTAATRCGSRSEICARPKSTSPARGSCCGSTPLAFG